MSVEQGIPATILFLKMVTLVFGIFCYKKNKCNQPCVIANNPLLTSQSVQQHKQKRARHYLREGYFLSKIRGGIFYDLSGTTRTLGSRG